MFFRSSEMIYALNLIIIVMNFSIN